MHKSALLVSFLLDVNSVIVYITIRRKNYKWDPFKSQCKYSVCMYIKVKLIIERKKLVLSIGCWLKGGWKWACSQL